MNNKTLYIYIFFFLLFVIQLKAQQPETKKFDRQKWNELKRDLDYDEIKNYNNWTDDFDDEGVESGSNKMGDETQKKQDNQGRGFGKYSKNGKSDSKTKTIPEDTQKKNNINEEQNPPAWLSNFLLIILGAVLAGVLLWILFSNYKPVNIKAKITIQDDNLEETIEKTKTELELMLEKTITNKDYRLAVRIYFVFIIKLLKEHNLINWEKKKTNTAYLREMQNNNHYFAFYNSVNIFEMIWYGKRQLNEDEFYKIEPLFKNFMHNISHRH